MYRQFYREFSVKLGFSFTRLLTKSATIMENARIAIFPIICAVDVEISSTTTDSAARTMEKIQTAFSLPLHT